MLGRRPANGMLRRSPRPLVRSERSPRVDRRPLPFLGTNGGFSTLLGIRGCPAHRNAPPCPRPPRTRVFGGRVLPERGEPRLCPAL